MNTFIITSLTGLTIRVTYPANVSMVEVEVLHPEAADIMFECFVEGGL